MEISTSGLCVILPNFAKIGRTDPEIWPIFDFQDGAVRTCKRIGNSRAMHFQCVPLNFMCPFSQISEFRLLSSLERSELGTRKNELGKFRLLPYVDCACARVRVRHYVTSLTLFIRCGAASGEDTTWRSLISSGVKERRKQFWSIYIGVAIADT